MPSRYPKQRKPNRLQEYDYSQAGYYFITVCTKNMAAYFGRIEAGKTILNRYGKIARQCWLEIPKHFSNVSLDEYIIMPNHIHGVIIIENDDSIAGNRHARSVRIERHHQKLPMAMGSFKSAVTKLCKKNNCEFNWQKSFYDHVIRNDESLYEIRQYIQNNPARWEWDRNNPEIC